MSSSRRATSRRLPSFRQVQRRPEAGCSPSAAATMQALLILQQLLSGMNAHINLDLGIASAQVSPGDQLPQLKPDFDEINALLAGQVGTVEAEIASLSPLIGDLEKVGLRTETSVVNFSMQAA